MLGGVPLVHRLQLGLWLLHCDNRALGQYIEVLVGDHGGDLDDAVALRHQAGHFEIDPDQIGGVRVHGR